jgi:hypothetical protein
MKKCRNCKKESDRLYCSTECKNQYLKEKYHKDSKEKHHFLLKLDNSDMYDGLKKIANNFQPKTNVGNLINYIISEYLKKNLVE